MVRRIPLPPGWSGTQWIQVVRVHYHPGDSYDLHDHEFAEVFWIERGTAWHRIAGKDQLLQPGSVVLMRPADAHAYRAPEGFVMVNVTFRPELLDELRQRFGPQFASWPWDDAPGPRVALFDRVRLQRLQECAELLANDHSRLAAEGFLLDLLRLLVSRPPEDLPPWLERAMALFQAPQALAAGPGEFCRLCARTPAHVNRAVRAAFATTTTGLVNRLRLEHAARQLKLTDEGIAGIAAGCGFASLAHFYRAFKARFAVTPRAFRHGHHAVGRTVPEHFRSAVPVPVDRPTRRR